MPPRTCWRRGIGTARHTHPRRPAVRSQAAIWTTHDVAMSLANAVNLAAARDLRGAGGVGLDPLAWARIIPMGENQTTPRGGQAPPGGGCDGVRKVAVHDCTVTGGWPGETSRLMGIDATMTWCAKLTSMVGIDDHTYSRGMRSGAGRRRVRGQTAQLSRLSKTRLSRPYAVPLCSFSSC
jgi:hypothetical protein